MSSSNRSRLLLVDDDEVILATFGGGLRDAGYEVAVAGSGSEALAVLADTPPDMVIVDKRMPGMSGFDLARQLRTTGVPFLFLSAYNDPQYVAEAIEIGAMGYLVKPLEVDKAVPTLEAALRRSRELSALADQNARMQQALDTGRSVNVVVGIMMERFRMGQKQAFDALRCKARAERRKVREVAEEMLVAWNAMGDLGALPADCRGSRPAS